MLVANNTRSNDQNLSSVPEDHVVVGRIRGIRGLRGDLRVEALTDFPERFAPDSIVYLDNQPAVVLRSEPFKQGLILRLQHVGDRTTAESVVGRYLTVPETDIKPLPDGSYYHFQILEMEVWTEEGERVGEIREIISTGGNDVYVIRREGQKELLIPAIGDVVKKVDVPNNKITVRLPEGLM